MLQNRSCKHIGGKENVVSAEHCATRLRLILKDDSRFDKKKQIEAIDGVKGSFKAAGQHQIILGTGFVDKVYAQFMEIANFQEGELKTKAEATAGNMNWFQKASRLLGDVPAHYSHPGCYRLVYGRTQPDHQPRRNVGPHGIDPFPGADRYGIRLPTSPGHLLGHEKVWRFPALGIVIGLMLVAPQLPNANQVAAGNVEPIYLSFGALSVPIVGYQVGPARPGAGYHRGQD